MTFEELQKANSEIEKIDIKGKAYAQVTDRVLAFRKLFPNGSINTEIVEMSDGVVTIKAYVRDENGSLLGTGLAQEKETSSFINKTSYVENCETSAVGRALGMVGIGGSIASTEEMLNAVMNQQIIESVDKDLLPTEDGKVTKSQLEKLRVQIKRVGSTEEEFLGFFDKATKLTDLSQVEVIASINRLMQKKDGEGLKK